VDIDKAIGKPHSLWCAFAKFYERHGDVPNARVVFEKAVQVSTEELTLVVPGASFQISRQESDLSQSCSCRPVY
jgi:predicted GH43/DUF377 family glycosyl hydrolase